MWPNASWAVSKPIRRLIATLFALLFNAKGLNPDVTRAMPRRHDEEATNRRNRRAQATALRESTAARDAPTAAPSLSATGSMYLVKLSRLCIARPPEMPLFAEVNSGRSDFDSSSPTKPEMPGIAAAAAGSILGAATASPAAWNAAVRTVITFFCSGERTVWMALPA